MNNIQPFTNSETGNYDINLEESITYLIYRIDKALARDFSESLGHGDISTQQWRLLSSLKSRNGKSTISELSACTVMKQTIVSRLINDMQDNGFVEKAQRPDDLRITEVTLTAKGNELFESILPLALRHHDRALAYLNKKEIGQVTNALKQIQFNLGIRSFDQ